MKTARKVGYAIGLDGTVNALRNIDREAAAALVPQNWLDPLLTGPNAVIGNYPYTGRDIENLLNAVRDRIRKGTPMTPRRE